MNKDNIPVLIAFRNESDCLDVWCPYCVKWHHHGQGDGHRSAHCSNQDSPFKNGGYYIQEISKKDIKAISKRF